MRRKLIFFFLSILLIGSLAVVAFAAPEEPEITLQPQSPNYPNYSVAIYMVKVSGTNLSATWYMEWMGKTYTISGIGGTMQDWEPYAGESYGARKLDDNTFAFIFEGIEYELDGAYIWCVIEDGHYDVTSQKVRISVGNSNTPPEIVSIPAQLTVAQGEEAEIRCVAKSPDGSQLSFLWYETDTGRMEDMRAVNRGTETGDFLFCDTSSLGTRNYICMVKTADGGVAYSSLVPVTVTEKAAVQQEPTETQAATSPPTEPATAQTQPPTPTENMPTPTETGSLDTSDPTDSSGIDTSVPTEATNPTEVPTKDREDPTPPNGGLPWWALSLITFVSAGAGVGTAVLLIRKNKK